MRRERHCDRSVRRLDDQGKWVPVENWIDAEVMEHENGFRLICLGKSPPLRAIEFRYVKRDVAFEFYAQRCHRGGTVTGTYLVTTRLKPGQKFGSNARPIERAEIEAIAADINLGLRTWPSPQADQTIPIGVVHFFFGSSLLDRLTFGEPLALRGSPASPRWLRHTVRHRVSSGLYGPYTYRECTSLVREDGVQLVRIPKGRGPQNDGPDDYHYVKPDTSFFFTAERRLYTEIVTDTWEVRLDPLYRDGFSPAKRAKLGPAKCAQIVRNIEEALYAWPSERDETEWENVPITRVVFLDPP